MQCHCVQIQWSVFEHNGDVMHRNGIVMHYIAIVKRYNGDVAAKTNIMLFIQGLSVFPPGNLILSSPIFQRFAPWFQNTAEACSYCTYNWLNNNLKVPCACALKAISGVKAYNLPLPTLASKAVMPFFK